MTTHWILVAAPAMARILIAQQDGSLHAVEEIANPDAPLRVRAPAPTPGPQKGLPAPSPVTGSSAASVFRRAPDPMADLFARRVSRHLSQALNQQRFEALLMVAAPPFLVLLRQHLGTATRARLTATLERDLVHLPQDEIATQLKEAAWSGRP